MYRIFENWLKLTYLDKWLFFCVFFITGLIRAALFIFPFKWIALFLGNEGVESPVRLRPREKEKAIKIGGAINKVSRYTPWESKCLVQAITGKLLLGKENIENTLYFGVKRKENDQISAHAWLRAGEIIVTGRRGYENYAPISCFGKIMIPK